MLRRIAVFIQRVAINSCIGKAVVHPQLLQLPVGFQQRAAVPETHIFERANTLLAISGAEPCRVDDLTLDLIQLEAPLRGLNGIVQIALLQCKFPWPHHQPAR